MRFNCHTHKSNEWSKDKGPSTRVFDCFKTVNWHMYMTDALHSDISYPMLEPPLGLRQSKDS